MFQSPGALLCKVAGPVGSLPARLAIAAAATTAAVAAAAVAAAATAAAAAVAAATAAAAAITAVFARAGFVDSQTATVDFLPVKLRDGSLAILLGRHLDEPEAARAARLAILNHRSRLDRARLCEQLLQIFTRRLEREIADVKFH